MTDDLFQNVANLPTTSQLIITGPTVGERLQNMRLKHELTIAESSLQSHIPAHTIEALENNDWAHMPVSTFYLPGILQHLCESYGEDSTDLLAAYDKIANDLNTPKASSWNEKDLENTDQSSGGTGGTNSLLTWFFLSAIVLIIAIIITGWHVSNVQRRRMQENAHELHLPSILSAPALPMRVLEIPQS